MTIEKLKIILFKINDSLRKILFLLFLRDFLYKKNTPSVIEEVFLTIILL